MTVTDAGPPPELRASFEIVIPESCRNFVKEHLLPLENLSTGSMLSTDELHRERSPAYIRRRDSDICLHSAAQARRAATLARKRGADTGAAVEMAHECLRRSRHYSLAARHLGWRLPD
jgi:hypothetical protein